MLSALRARNPNPIMRHVDTLAPIVLLACLAGSLAHDLDAQRRRTSWRDRSDLQNLVYKADQKFATKQARNAVYSIYLPKDYDAKANAETLYPVIYFLHGMREDNNRFHDRGGAQILDKLVGEKVLPPHLFVCVYDGSRSSFYVNGRQGKIEDMIVGDLRSHIEKTYRVRKERDARALLGVSMGGFGAMKIALRHPDLFVAVATHSAAILPAKYEDLDKLFPWAKQSRLAFSIFGNPVDEELYAAENPLALARKADVAALAGLRIYFDCGDRDRYGLEATNEDLHRTFEKKKVKHTWTLVKGGNHGWRAGYNAANLPKSLKFLGAAFAQKKAVRGLAGSLGGALGGTGKTSEKNPKKDGDEDGK